MKKFLFTILSVLTILIYISYAGDAPDYLIKGTSAKVSAMGDTFTAIANDANSIYWNPAGLGTLSIPQLLSTHSSLNDFDMNTENISVVYPLKRGGIGVNIIYSNIGSIPKTATNQLTGRANLLGLFDESEIGYLLSYGQKVSENLSVGASLKGVRVEFDTYNESGIGLDLGLLYNFSNEFSAGLNLQNIGEIELGKHSIPFNAKIGAAYKSPKNNFILGVDFDTNILGESIYHIGAEYQIVKGLFARIGTNDGDLTVGVGFKFENWQFDYAFNDMEVGDIHKLSVLLDFTPKKKPETIIEKQKERVEITEKKPEKKIEQIVEKKETKKVEEEILTLPPSTPKTQETEKPKKGKIVDAKVKIKDKNEVSFYLGEESGIKKGDLITVLSQGKEIADVRVTLVGYAISYGEIEKSYTDLDEFELFLGDQIVLP